MDQANAQKYCSTAWYESKSENLNFCFEFLLIIHVLIFNDLSATLRFADTRNEAQYQQQREESV